MIKKQAERILLERKKARRWLALILCMALLATSGVFAWLRMDGQALDGSGRILDCKYKTHSHGAECYDDEGNLACGQADYVVHEHDDSCYGEDGQLVCTLEEHEAHVHDESCYEEKRVLACGQEEAGEGTQDESQAGNGTGQEAKDSGGTVSGGSKSNVTHVHTEECYETQKVLACDELELHTHDEECYDEDGNLTCGKLELKEHKHGEECFRDATEDGASDAEADEAGGTAGRDTVSGDSASGNSMSVDSVDESTSSGGAVSGDSIVSGDGGSGSTVSRDSESGSGATVSGDTASGSTEGARFTQEAETENYLVTVTYGEEAGLPEDAQLKVEEITEESDPDQWAQKAEASREVIGSDEVEMYLMLKIGFYGQDGEEIEPTYPVQVNVQDKEKKDREGGGEVSIVHFAREEGQEHPEAIGNYSTDAEGKVTFEVGSFSIVTFSEENNESSFPGYVDNFSVSEVTDGTIAFNTDVETSDNGTDKDGKNGVVRSFDSIKYKLSVTTACYEESQTATSATLCFEMTMKLGLTEAEFNKNVMTWIGNNWQIEYLDDEGKVVYVKKNDCGEGELYKVSSTSGNEYTLGEKTSINAIVNGSTASENSYKPTTGTVEKQRITGTMTLKATENYPDVLRCTQEFAAGIKVLNATNGEKIKPTFKVWLDGNENNCGFENSKADNSNNSPTPQDRNTIVMDGDYDSGDSNYAVKVSAGNLYNLSIDQNGDFTYKSWFDFSTGQEVSASNYTVSTDNGDVIVSGADMKALLVSLADLKQNYDKSDPKDFTNDSISINGNETVSLPSGTSLTDYTGENGIFSNIRYGRMQGYGVGLNLANQSTNNGEYGMKGLTLPVGDITFDVNFTTRVEGEGDWNVKKDQYYAILWEAEPNINPGTKPSFVYEDGQRSCVENYTPWVGNQGLMGRNLSWNNESRSPYGKGAGPFNQYTSNTTSSSCYYGGTWSLTKVGDDTGATKTTANIEDGTIYQFTVSGYDFDLNDYTFPTEDAGNAGDVTGYATYKYYFATNYMQVLNVMPYRQSGTANLHMTLTAGDISVRSLSGTSTKDESEKGEITYKSEVYTDDNKKEYAVAIFSPGNIMKRNLFAQDRKISNGKNDALSYLLCKGWSPNELSSDASAFAGSNIAIVGGITLSPATDLEIYALNILQLFDSRALSINKNGVVGEPQWQVNSSGGNLGKVKWLYAADPDFPSGYDMNDLQIYETDKTVGKENKTNELTIAQYMNYVDEEDLVYGTDVDSEGYVLKEGKQIHDDKGNPLKCIGVLMEARDCINVWHGTYVNIHIPVTVNGSDPSLLSKTTGTVNSYRAWMNKVAAKAMEDVSWTDGEWKNKKNHLTGYVPIENYNSNNESTGNGLSKDNDAAPFVKAEYENGNTLQGTNKNYQDYGNSLLILGYKSSVKIESEKTDGTKDYNLSYEDGIVYYTLKGIKTELENNPTSGTNDEGGTDLTIGVSLTGKDENGAVLTGNALNVDILSGLFAVEEPVYKKDDDGNYIVDSTTSKTIDGSEANATEIKIWYGEKEYALKFYVTINSDRKTAEIHISGAPVGASLPDITFQAQLGKGLADNSHVTATATISGTGDARAYDIVNGNMSNDTVNIIKLGGSSIFKDVDTTRIELDGSMVYTLSYTNKDANPLTDEVYLYDIFPYKGDGRGSTVSGNGSGISLKDISVNGVKDAEIYYSTANAAELRKKIEGFSGATGEDSKNKIKEMLNSGSFNRLGELTASTSGNATPGIDFNGGEIPCEMTCIYAVVKGIDANATLKLTLTIETEGNEAADIYGNQFDVWAPEKGTNTNLRSNLVQTEVVSRSISGVVWHDANLNGIRDSDEPLISGVQCTLFKKSDDNGYKVCTTDVTGEPIGTVSNGQGDGTIETGEDGSYSFEKLGSGEYVVAFKGGILDYFTDSTTFYQVNGENDENSNDGGNDPEFLAGLNEAGTINSQNEYKYFIKYSSDTKEMELHSITEYKTNSDLLTGYQENYPNQDLGLITPEIAKINRGDIEKAEAEGGTLSLTDENYSLLSGAEFTLVSENGIEFQGKTNASGSGSSKNGGTGKWDEGIIKWYDSMGNRIYAYNIGDGEYTLKETMAPDGYALNTSEWKVKFTDGNIEFVGSGEPETATYTITKNGQQKSVTVSLYLFPDTMLYELPSAGGIGIYWYMAGGMALMMAASYIMYEDRMKRLMRARRR